MRKDTADGITGKLHLELRTGKGKIQAVNIRSSRPEGLTRILLGRSVEEALVMVPRLFGVAPLAQSYAAACALESSLSVSTLDSNMAARNMLVKTETLEEHLQRIFLDWPQMMGEKVPETEISEFSKFIRQLKQGLDPDKEAFQFQERSFHADFPTVKNQLSNLRGFFVDSVFGMDPIAWLQLGPEEILRWAKKGTSFGQTMMQNLYELGFENLAPRTHKTMYWLGVKEIKEEIRFRDAEEFASRPTLQGEVLEVTPLSRLQADPMIKGLKAILPEAAELRLFVRLYEIAISFRELVAEIDHPQASCQFDQHRSLASQGVAQIEGARGKLIHWVELEERRIKSYVILDPTEWNFHPKGPFVDSLVGLPHQDDRKTIMLAHFMAQLFDPSVEYEIRILPS